MGEWRIEPLIDCLATLIDYRGKSPPKSETGIPVLSAKVVKTTGLLRPIEQTIAPDYYSVWMTRGLPQPGDVVMTTEAPMGEVIQLDEETSHFALGQRIVCMRGKPEKLDNTFLRYLLTSPKQQELLESFATGTTVLGISQKALRLMPISFPDFAQQQQIGQALAALDDKIEVNRRMNATLEAMARAIFKDWFVDFGPTRAKIEGREPYLAPDIWDLFSDKIDDEGKPEGWTTAPIEALASHIAMGPFGSRIKKESFVESGVPVIRGKNLADGFIDQDFVFVTKEKADELGNSKARPSDIVFTHRGTLGQIERIPVGANYPEYIVSQNQLMLSVNKEMASPIFISYYFKSEIGQWNWLANKSGAGVPAIARPSTTLKEIRVDIPSSYLMAEFDDLTSTIEVRQVGLSAENCTLAQTRDLLLSKLMSGEIRLKDAERTVEEMT